MAIESTDKSIVYVDARVVKPLLSEVMHRANQLSIERGVTISAYRLPGETIYLTSGEPPPEAEWIYTVEEVEE